MTPRTKAFLDTLAFSELGTRLMNHPLSDNGYKVIVGGTFFDSYEDHPRKRVYIPKLKIYSTAAGRYQVLSWIFTHYKKQLNLSDFSPKSQDKIAIQLIKECKALNLIEQGRIDEALFRCRSRWASLPGAGYKQHENSLKSLLSYYDRAIQKYPENLA